MKHLEEALQTLAIASSIEFVLSQYFACGSISGVRKETIAPLLCALCH
jgi:hypothetical protein